MPLLVAEPLSARQFLKCRWQAVVAGMSAQHQRSCPVGNFIILSRTLHRGMDACIGKINIICSLGC